MYKQRTDDHRTLLLPKLVLGVVLGGGGGVNDKEYSNSFELSKQVCELKFDLIKWSASIWAKARKNSNMEKSTFEFVFSRMYFSKRVYII
jgi:hypothetical protein